MLLLIFSSVWWQAVLHCKISGLFPPLTSLYVQLEMSPPPPGREGTTTEELTIFSGMRLLNCTRRASNWCGGEEEEEDPSAEHALAVNTAFWYQIQQDNALWLICSTLWFVESDLRLPSLCPGHRLYPPRVPLNREALKCHDLNALVEFGGLWHFFLVEILFLSSHFALF